MKSFQSKLIILFVGLMCCAVQPSYAQWSKVAKSASSVAKKAISKNGKKASSTITKSATKRTTTTTSGYGTSAAGRAASQYTTATCTTCSGRGSYYYNGYQYACSSCGGRGYVVVRR